MSVPPSYYGGYKNVQISAFQSPCVGLSFIFRLEKNFLLKRRANQFSLRREMHAIVIRNMKLQCSFFLAKPQTLLLYTSFMTLLLTHIIRRRSSATFLVICCRKFGLKYKTQKKSKNKVFFHRKRSWAKVKLIRKAALKQMTLRNYMQTCRETNCAHF